MAPNFIIGVLLVTIAGNCIKVQAEIDDDFAKFLEEKMNNYSAWLTENELDPSPLTNGSMSGFGTLGVYLDCHLSNHYLLGHSKVGQYFGTSKSSFTQHTFEMGRIVLGLYEFQGDFDCYEVLDKYDYPELGEDLQIRGQGQFIMTTHFSIEPFTMNNVGITTDYKLNLTNSWPEYSLNAGQKDFQVKGQWNESLISGDYLEDVDRAFAIIYDTHSFAQDNLLKFPSGQLLDRYVREVAKSADLTEIIDEDELPEPFVPTPRPNTTATATTAAESNVGKLVR